MYFLGGILARTRSNNYIAINRPLQLQLSTCSGLCSKKYIGLRDALPGGARML
jgi:hypothetical protein